MQSLTSHWTEMDGRRRIMVVATATVVMLSLLGLARLATNSSMSLLYSGLEPAAAGEVVQALEQRGITFEIRNNAIFVDAARRDELRMTLASEGLPANTGQGYELLDNLSGFGTTAQMFDAAYWRAKEGELARTILANSGISAARVHIANTTTQPFRKAAKPTASVTITPAGGPLPASQSKALVYLVSSAVAGLSPDDVAVIDSRNGLISSGEDKPGASTDSLDRAESLRQNLLRLLEARVGPGKAVVEVSIETVTESEAITERNIDPDSRVAISQDVEERSGKSSDAADGSVTVASNLPQGDVNAGNGKSSSTNTETRERTNYEVSERTREVVRNPGAIKRLSIAVLLDGVVQSDATTGLENWSPRSDEELGALRDLVASAAGFDTDRGDSITIKSLQFEPLPTLGTAAPVSLLRSFNLDIMTLIQVAVLSLVSLVLGLFVLRPIFMRPPVPRRPELAPPALKQPTSSSWPPTQEAAALTGEIEDDADPLPRTLREAGSAADWKDAKIAGAPDPATRLRQLISDRHHESLEILRSWMDDTEESAS